MSLESAFIIGHSSWEKGRLGHCFLRTNRLCIVNKRGEIVGLEIWFSS